MVVVPRGRGLGPTDVVGVGKEQQAMIEEGSVAGYQVNLLVTFVLE
jgi:flavin-binding protein dodecin